MGGGGCQRHALPWKRAPFILQEAGWTSQGQSGRVCKIANLLPTPRFENRIVQSAARLSTVYPIPPSPDWGVLIFFSLSIQMQGSQVYFELSHDSFS
jgi:hypothetical protein